jgi:hypothetical protein
MPTVLSFSVSGQGVPVQFIAVGGPSPSSSGKLFGLRPSIIALCAARIWCSTANVSANARCPTRSETPCGNAETGMPFASAAVASPFVRISPMRCANRNRGSRSIKPAVDGVGPPDDGLGVFDAGGQHAALGGGEDVVVGEVGLWEVEESRFQGVQEC